MVQKKEGTEVLLVCWCIRKEETGALEKKKSCLIDATEMKEQRSYWCNRKQETEALLIK